MEYKAVLKGTFIALGITLAIIIITAIVNCFWTIGAEVTRIISLVALAIGIVFSSFGVCSGCEKMKIFNALIIGVCCIIVIMIVSILLCGSVGLNMHFLTACSCCIISSVLGAVLSA